MRRIDNGHATRPPPFRVLAAPDPNYLSPSVEPPPPPRAPEPYKVAPSTTSFAKAHRRSSFVIIADSRPTTPEARSPSPTLATGRVSPFRGRGFKGPPPRSKSRPQSPESFDSKRRLRNDRRVSVSQQNSPRRSLIPQPTRRRSISLSKTEEQGSSPKIGRRVDSRTRLNTTESRNRLNTPTNNNSLINPVTRRPSTRAGSKLSPIQGTPTKPEKNTTQIRRNDRFNQTLRIQNTSKGARNQNSPNKNVGNHQRRQEKNFGKDKIGSPSKIPLKTNRNSTNSLNPPRFITLSNQSDKANKKIERAIKEVSVDYQITEVSQNGEKTEGSSKESQSSDKTSGTNEKSSNELDIREILKLSSGATGTSSVVNTTTATAAQPLHIDANTILIDKNELEKRTQNDQTKIDGDTSVSKSSNLVNVNADTPKQSQQNSNQDSNQNQSSKASKPGNTYTRTKSIVDSKIESPVVGDRVAGHSKNNSVSQSVKAINRINGVSSTTGSATQRSSRNQNESSLKNARSIDSKIADDVTLIQSSSPSRIIKSIDTEVSDAEKVASTSNQEKKSSTNEKTNESNVTNNGTDSSIISSTSVSASGNNANNANTPSSTIKSSKNNNVPVKSASGAAVSNSQGTNNSRIKNRNENRGSNSSLKSAGVSSNSIESARSTDTGVSVNTVRGVSSPREKTGVHVVKRTQEIETLSGNIMHLEQNGEPALLTSNSNQEQVPQRLLTRWRKNLGRYCQCCPSMRCLACKSDHKGLSWLRSNTKMTKPISKIRNQESQAPQENTTNSVKTSCWSRLKSRCRCNRLREVKCCARRARVAPAEQRVCCPPERRFGAICRRLFDRCKCKRSEAERTRNIRAKHSLTSVAPPPLSEEPKAKIPDVLVEHNSLMRGAIPCLPVPLAWFCLVWNVLLPGSGTVWSGIFNLCTGQPRFSQVAGLKSRLGSFVVNLVVGVGQLFTVLFCLVGWGWSIWWGVTLVRLARKYRRFKASEAASNDPEARTGEQAALPPGVPSQALREMERVR